MPVDWEGRYRRGETRWEKGAPAPPLVEFLSRHRMSGEVLVPGCGTGHDVRAIAAGGASVLGIDIAPSAIRLAREHRPAGNERYALADFLKPPEELAGGFDWLFEHTLFCAIDPDRRHDYAASATTSLKPGGLFLAIFYLDPTDPEPGEPPFPVTTEELDDLFGKDFDLLEDWTPRTAHPGREGRERVRLMRLKLGP
ncbi:MAG TPA: methyltransferase domain-containing protein [Verrucomicrobiae bacterium]|nr:methyltransferase domain-containing protein [Verrucomicrobiae bacterium]